MYRREVNGPFRELRIGLLIGSGLLRPIDTSVQYSSCLAKTSLPGAEVTIQDRVWPQSPLRRSRSINRTCNINIKTHAAMTTINPLRTSPAVPPTALEI